MQKEARVRVEELAGYLNEYLRVGAVPDAQHALNGLQAQSRSGVVQRIGAAVDASLRTIESAAEAECDLLLVHHGLFWDGLGPWTGRRFRKVRLLVERGLAVYSAHLPLDVHEQVGNNAVLARALGVDLRGTFGQYEGVDLGRHGVLEIRREALAARLDELLGGRVRMLPGGAERVRTVGVITGGGGSMIGQAIEAGLDAYVTGEGAHYTYFDAMEGGINVYYGGHYATETWGVRALAEHIEEEFGIPWVFLDHPTGM
jgi:dinuclear metal center YbgI/SA1388 family protein